MADFRAAPTGALSAAFRRRRTRRAIARRLREERGQGLVEFALLLPILLMFLMGIIQFGLIFNGYLTLENAARNGVRAASLQASAAAIDKAVLDSAGALNTSLLTVTVNPSATPRVTGSQVTVSVRYAMPIIVPFLHGLLGQSLSMSAAATMRVES